MSKYHPCADPALNMLIIEFIDFSAQTLSFNSLNKTTAEEQPPAPRIAA